MSDVKKPCPRLSWHHTITFHLLGIGFRIAFRLYAKWQIIGRENVPRRGPIIFAANHASYVDPPLAWASIYGYRRMWGLAKEELWKRGIISYLMNSIGAVPVKRHTADRVMIRRCLELLACGETIGIFPEGTRTYDGLLNPAEPGMALLCQKSGAPILPVALIGTYEMLPRSAKKWKRCRLKVVYGKPLTFAANTSREEIGATVMREIARLLTENGVPMEAPAPERALTLPKE